MHQTIFFFKLKFIIIKYQRNTSISTSLRIKELLSLIDSLITMIRIITSHSYRIRIQIQIQIQLHETFGNYSKTSDNRDRETENTQ